MKNLLFTLALSLFSITSFGQVFIGTTHMKTIFKYINKYEKQLKKEGYTFQSSIDTLRYCGDTITRANFIYSVFINETKEAIKYELWWCPGITIPMIGKTRSSTECCAQKITFTNSRCFDCITNTFLNDKIYRWENDDNNKRYTSTGRVQGLFLTISRATDTLVFRIP